MQNSCTYTGWAKKGHPFGIEFTVLLDALYLPFLFCFHVNNCNFAAIVGLTNDERYLIYDLRVVQHRGSERIMKEVFSNK